MRHIERASIIIRQVEATDYYLLARFFEENNRLQITLYFHPFPLTSRTAYEIACKRHQDRFYVAISDNKILGFCMLRGWEEGFQKPSFGVMIDYRYQGLGLGRRMTLFAIEEAKKLGCRKIILSVYSSNFRAVDLYESLGFYELSCTSCILGGKPDLKIIMGKRLK